MANNLLPPIQRPHEDVNTIVSLKTEAEKPEPFQEDNKFKQTVAHSSIISKTNNVMEIPEASEAEEEKTSTPRKGESENRWDRNSKMPP